MLYDQTYANTIPIYEPNMQAYGDQKSKKIFWTNEKIGAAVFISIDLLAVLFLVLAIFGVFDTHKEDAPIIPTGLPPPVVVTQSVPYLGPGSQTPSLSPAIPPPAPPPTTTNPTNPPTLPQLS